jgi:nucleoside-diphosphate-sugar epimerase
VKSAEVIYETLSRQIANGEKAAHWIQISGASALSAGEYTDDSFVYGSASDLVFDDLKGTNEFRDYIQRNPVRKLDNYVAAVAVQTPELRVAHILPPIIYGQGRGPVNKRSVQVPELARITLLRKRGVRVGAGLNRWGAIHVRDLGQLLLLLVEDALETEVKNGVWGSEGIYLPSESEWVRIAGISDVIGRC